MAGLVASLAGAAVSGLATAASSMGTAGMQTSQAEKSQQSQQSFQSSVLDRGEKAYTDAGLPKFMYYNNNAQNQGPNTLYHLGGSNFYEGTGVNSNLPFFSSPYSQYMHGGKPLPSANSGAKPNKDQNQNSSSGPIAFENSGSQQQTIPKTIDDSGQSDRVGLGAGRYSAVPPPSTYSYNAGTQTSFTGPNTKNASTQMYQPKILYGNSSRGQSSSTSFRAI